MSLSITDWIWRGERFAPDIDLLRDDAVARLAELEGQFACHRTDGQRHVLARDPLGVNKLFFAIDEAQAVHSASYLIELVRLGHPLRSIWSVPAGHCLVLEPRRQHLELHRFATLDFDEGGDDVAPVIRQRLDVVFARLAPALAGRRVFVTLSGGLDSTAVAALARRALGRVTAVSFSLVEKDARESEDLAAARRVAAALDLEHVCVMATPDEILDRVDHALVHGQDWRDFNVHCALVNALIGAAIGRDGSAGDAGATPVVLTGDVMNELMADYVPVRYGGREYYALPDLPPGKLRRFLVTGLDAGDREVGVLHSFGVDTIEPYAMCARAYAKVPAASLAEPGAKQQLARRVLGSLVPEFVYQRGKVRAQVGGTSERGTLGVLADAGMDQAWLRRRFAELVHAGEADLQGFVRAGCYRFPTSWAALRR